MSKEIKPKVDYETTLGALDIRLGRVISAELCPSAPKQSYLLKIDFGKFGQKSSVGRFTQHQADELVDSQVVAVLNFESRKIGDEISEVLVLGVQYPKADSGEATFLSPAREAKIGGKVF